MSSPAKLHTRTQTSPDSHGPSCSSVCMLSQHPSCLTLQTAVKTPVRACTREKAEREGVENRTALSVSVCVAMLCSPGELYACGGIT